MPGECRVDKVPSVWLEDVGRSNRPSAPCDSPCRKGTWSLCLGSERDEAARWNSAGVVAGRGFVCFPAQFTANDRATGR